MCLLGVCSRRRVLAIYAWHAIAMTVTFVAQFGQPMLLGSVHLAFVPTAVFTLWIFGGAGGAKADGIVNGALSVGFYNFYNFIYYYFFQVGFQAFFTCALSLLINYGIKFAANLDADEHIYKFVKGKFGIR
jgi:hypothetical protein